MVCRDPPEHDADHGEADEGGSFASVTFEVLGETTAVANLGEGSFDDPALGQDNKAVEIGALDDVQPPRTGLGDGLGHFRPLVAAISVDALDEGEGAASLSQHDSGAVTVLNIGGMNDYDQQEAKGVDEDVALAPFDLLARVVTRGIERGPPFTAPLALCASMMATLGLASRPACSRAATYSAW
jgi:hypothetical protein